jgi:hypothetical protein
MHIFFWRVEKLCLKYMQQENLSKLLITNR